MPKTVIRSDRMPTPVASYSSAVRADKFVFVSGQIPLDPETGELVTGGIERETRRVLDNLTLVLEAAHATLADVVKVTVFLTDMADFKSFDADGFTLDQDTACAQATLVPYLAMGNAATGGSKGLIGGGIVKRLVNGGLVA